MDKTFSVDTAEESSGFLLWQVTSLWQRGIRRALEPYDLTHSQFVLMASVYWLTLHGEDVTQVVLSSHTKIDQMTTSTVLRTLQQKKWLERHEHKTDTRAKTVALTEAGKELIQRVVPVVEQFDKDFFACLPNGAGEFNQALLALLKAH